MQPLIYGYTSEGSPLSVSHCNNLIFEAVRHWPGANCERREIHLQGSWGFSADTANTRHVCLTECVMCYYWWPRQSLKACVCCITTQWIRWIPKIIKKSYILCHYFFGLSQPNKTSLLCLHAADIFISHLGCEFFTVILRQTSQDFCYLQILDHYQSTWRLHFHQ